MKCSLILSWAIWSHLAILTNEISSNNITILDILEIKCQIKTAIHCL